MSKRGHEEEIAFLAKRLKKLEKQLKQSPASPSSCSTCSSTSSSCSSSRHASPVPDHPNGRDTSMRDIGMEENVPSTVGTSDVPPSRAIHPPKNDAPQPPPISGPSSAASAVLAPPPVPVSQSSADPGTSATNDLPVTADDDDIMTMDDLIEVLGTDPSITLEYGEEINKDVANRFEYIATSGLDKEIKKELLEKYLVPANAKLVAAPQLNAEIKAAVTDLVIRRDKAIESRQKQIATAITNIGRTLTLQLNKKHRDNDLLKQLMDTGRILCDIQHTESEARRNFALYSLKKEIKEQLLTTKIDKYLFGTDLPETLKTAKAVSKSSSDLKFEAPKKSKASTSTTATKSLNWRAGPAAHRQPTGPPHKQPATTSRRHHHESSSHKSSHQYKQTRRR